MSKLGVIRRLSKESLSRGGAVDGVVTALIEDLNPFLDAVTSALQGRLSFYDNFSCKLVSLTFTSGVEQQINPQSNLKFTGALPVYAGGKSITKFKSAVLANGNIGLTLTLDEGGDANCTVIVLLG